MSTGNGPYTHTFTLQATPLVTPAVEGARAACDGDPVSACPYRPGTPEHGEWVREWNMIEASRREGASPETKAALGLAPSPEFGMPGLTLGFTGCLWALVDTDAPTEPRLFEIAGTGNGMAQVASNRRRVYLGTWQEPPYVFHLFEHEVAT